MAALKPATLELQLLAFLHEAEMTNGFLQGKSFPLGATPCDGGVNFSVFSKNSVGIELLLFDGVTHTKAAQVIPFDPQRNRTAHYWHIFVPGLGAGRLYGFRVRGPFEPQNGHWFDREKV